MLKFLADIGISPKAVAFFRLSDMRPANVNLHLRLVLTTYQPLLRSGAILSITQGRVRVRRLPV